MTNQGEGTSIKSFITETLDLPPSCIEFSQVAPEYFVVGTYNLEKDEDGAKQGDEEGAEGLEMIEEKKKQERNGSLILYKLENDELTLVHSVTHPSAILDLHFSPYKPDTFAIASSTGTISLYKLHLDPNNEVGRPHIAHFETFQLFPESTLVLSLAWHPSHPSLIGCTLSTSNAALVTLAEDMSNATLAREDLGGHDGLEAWTLAFTPPHPTSKSMPQSLYTGGDDSKLRCLSFPSLGSLRHPLSEIVRASPGGERGMRGHDAGVTAILPLPLGTTAGSDILLTGSYDDHVRVFAVHDYRPSSSSTKPCVLTSKNLGGGVWRLCFLDRESEKVEGGHRVFRVLASCMHAGTRILEVEGDKEGEWEIRVLARFEEHESMNYGSDVQPVRKREWRGVRPSQIEGIEEDKLEDKKGRNVVSTSFYDRRLCVWKVPVVAEPGSEETPRIGR